MSAPPRDAGLRVFASIAAVVVNGGLFAGMAIAGLVSGPTEPDTPAIIEFETIEILQKGAPRDPKLLPIKPTAPPPPPPEEKVVRTGPPEPVPEPEPPKPPDPAEVELQRERERQEKERRAKEAQERRRREEEAAAKRRREDMDRALAGIGDEDRPPEGSPDGYEGGTTSDPTKTSAFLGYMGQLKLVLQRNFELPATIAPDERRRLSCEVRFQLGADGKIKGEPTIARSSGNRFFDDAALRTVRKFGVGTPDKLPLPTEPKLRQLVLTRPMQPTMTGE